MYTGLILEAVLYNLGGRTVIEFANLGASCSGVYLKGPWEECEVPGLLTGIE